MRILGDGAVFHKECVNLHRTGLHISDSFPAENSNLQTVEYSQWLQFWNTGYLFMLFRLEGLQLKVGESPSQMCYTDR